MSKVFVLDTNQQPLQPCHPAKARTLLKSGQAAIWRRYPFTIILKHAVPTPTPSTLRLKIDPGSQTTGLAIVNDRTGEVVFAAELKHRGAQIRDALTRRRVVRKGRRRRKTRYRAPRFRNRARPSGWLAPSLESRVSNIMTWVNRLRRYCPLVALSMELVRFDTQKLQNPEISGIEYTQGELMGYEVREYLLEKFDRTCAYCGARQVPLEIEHIIPRSRGGSHRVSNLTLACVPCNQQKGNRTAAEFGHPEVQQRAKALLRDAAAVNSTRWALSRRLEATDLPVELGSGGQTKFNRAQQSLPKTHWLDAAAVGASTPARLKIGTIRPLHITAAGHGRRQRCRTDKYGFPVQHAPRAKSYLGFQTGDMVRATILRGKHPGSHVGRIAIRFRPEFRLQGFDVHPKYLRLLQHADGYEYEYGPLPPLDKGRDQGNKRIESEPGKP